MATHAIEKTEGWSLWKFAVGGAITGISAGIANIFYVIIYSLVASDSGTYGVDTMSVTIFSFLPVLLSAFVYYGLYSINHQTGTRNFIILGFILLVASLYGPFNPDSISNILDGFNFKESLMLDGTITYFLLPMHLIAGFMALYVLPKFVTAGNRAE
ncbi:MAG: hypothetical protein CL843_17420 [Crocinitomicaceae bacterium]|uniref:hypothetical protein n=1 Tax=Maribacter sp. UBA849 TaxID=1946806 RepID=UPI000C4B2CDD|nr:hypothetical protein [Maribacter sp. UBA849]MAX81948.1 hypothetical protein [Crocinitomicaceae bacterium]|tara:strand:- start:5886 stop:6356 length:471 start_codon:yes stop_codon:yes gene_type:complete